MATRTVLELEDPREIYEDQFNAELNANEISGSLELPLVNTVHARAFYNCTRLTAVSMESLKTVGEEAFYNCMKLQSFVAPRARVIGNFAFYRCPSLTTVSLSAVTDIGQGAFCECPRLRHVDMPNVTVIRSTAFQLSGLKADVTFPAVQQIDAGAFDQCFHLERMSLPELISAPRSFIHGCPRLKFLSVPQLQLSDMLSSFEWHPVEIYPDELTIDIGDRTKKEIQEITKALLGLGLNPNPKIDRDWTFQSTVTYPDKTFVVESTRQNPHLVRKATVAVSFLTGESFHVNVAPPQTLRAAIMNNDNIVNFESDISKGEWDLVLNDHEVANYTADYLLDTLDKELNESAFIVYWRDSQPPAEDAIPAAEAPFLDCAI